MDTNLLQRLAPHIKKMVVDILAGMIGDVSVAGDGVFSGKVSAETFRWDGREVVLGWIADKYVWMYASATTIDILDVDVSEVFPVGTKLRWKQGGAYQYGSVTAASYASDKTTLTVSGDTFSNAAITDNYFSYCDTPPGWTGTSDIVFVPLTAPLTSTSWDRDAHSTTAKTKIDLSAVFSVPAGVKAVYLMVIAKDSRSAANACFIQFSATNTAGEKSFGNKIQGVPNNVGMIQSGIVPCDVNGDIYYQIGASGTNTLDATIEVWGYWK